MANLFKVNTLVLTKQSVTATGNNLYVNGVLVGSGVYSTVNALQETGSLLFNRDAAISGGLEARIAITGQQAWDAANNNGINLSGNLSNTGAALIARDLVVSGGLEARIQQTGAAAVAHSNSVGFSVSGSLAQSGSNLYSHIIGGDSTLSGNLTATGQTLFARDAAISGGLEARIALTGLQAFLAMVGASGILQGQINALPTSANLALTGSNLFNLITGLSGQANLNYATIPNLVLTGQQAWSAAQNNAQNLSGNLTQTGILLLARDLSTSGVTDAKINLLSGYVNLQDAATGAANVAYSNNIGISTSGSIALTGSQAWNAANNNGINLSGNLTQTGIALITRDNAISGVLQAAINSIAAGTGNLTTNVVYTTGIQLIGGTKYFVGNTYIDNLFVTGSQFVVNTQDFYVGDNWIVMNATGGARDSALFISTGITGVSATGAILGLDVPSNTWRFGFGSQLTDLITLPRLASGEAVDALDTRLTQSGINLGVIIGNTGSASWNAANNNGVNLSGNLTQTGVALINRVALVSGYSDTLYGLNVLYLTGNQNAGGIKNFNSGSFSGKLGIGTTTPTYSLQVQKTATATPAFMVGGAFAGGPRIQTYGLDADASAYMGLGTDMAGGPYEHSIFYPAVSTSSLTYGTYNGSAFSEKMRLNNAGRLGLGTAAPLAHFHSSGAIRSDAAYFSGGTNLSDIFYGNFGQRLPHSTYTSFNTTPATWGWSYVQGNTGAPHQTSAQWYRSRLSLGSDYTIGTGVSTDYWLQMAVNRFGNKDIWFQTTEAGVTGAWIPAGVTVSGVLQTNLNSLSGRAENIFVQRTGNQLISGAKNFLTQITVGPNTTWGKSLIVGRDNTIYNSGAQIGTTNGNFHLDAESASHIYLNYYAGAGVYFGNGGSSFHSLITSAGNWNLGSSTDQGYRTHINGNLNVVGTYNSGGVNLADILYPRSNPSGFATNTKVDALSGYLDRAITKSVTVSTNYTVTSNDPQLIYCNFTNPSALSFPVASTVSGRTWNIKSINTGAIYLSGSTFDGQSVYNMSVPYMSQVIHAQAGGYYLID